MITFKGNIPTEMSRPAKTSEELLARMSDDPQAYNQHPIHHERLLTPEIVKILAESGNYNIYYAPASMMSEELAITALRAGAKLKDIPKKFRSENVCKLAIQNDDRDFETVPKSLRTKGLFDLVIDKNPLQIEHLPKACQDRDLIFNALKIDVSCLRHINLDLIDVEIAEFLYANSNDAFQILPSHFQNEVDRDILIKSATRNLGNFLGLNTELIDKRVVEYIKPKILKHDDFCDKLGEKRLAALVKLDNSILEHILDYDIFRRIATELGIETNLDEVDHGDQVSEDLPNP